MWTVYVIQSSSDGKFYIGCTSNLARRIVQHNSGHTFSTRHRGPFELVYSEQYNDRSIAFAREKEIKGYKGGIAFKTLLQK